MNYEREILITFTVIKEMLADRGVRVDGALDALSGEDVVAMSGLHHTFHVDIPNCGHRVVYDFNPRFKLADIRKHIEAEAADVTIVLVLDPPTTTALKGVHELKKDIQFFLVKELMFNISHNCKVPKHEIVHDKEEVAAILARYNTKLSGLPVILQNDPMARYLGLKPGQIVRITRVSSSNGVHTLYRHCSRTGALG